MDETAPHGDGDGVLDSATTADLAQFDCTTLNTLLDAARLVDAAADDLEWTVLNPADLRGMRRAAALLRLHAAAHQESSHGHSQASGEVESNYFSSHGDA